MEHLFARRMRQMRPSTIREILKVASQPDVISFAGGLPAPELFPMEEIRRACARVMAENGASALQYGGMFLWVTCPESLDTDRLLQSAAAHKVAFVPGRDFFPDRSGGNYMRLNFSNATPERIREGVKRLAGLCREAAG